MRALAALLISAGGDKGELNSGRKDSRITSLLDTTVHKTMSYIFYNLFPLINNFSWVHSVVVYIFSQRLLVCFKLEIQTLSGVTKDI